MTRLPPTNAVSADAEGELARLCEEISDRLRRQEPVDLEDYVARWPAHANELRQLLPAMRMMAGLPAESPPTSADATVPGVTPNQSLGDFRIVREIGRGGMGIVYEAEQLSLRRNVALKVLPFAAVLDSRQLRRFHNEAQAAALLHHPQIVPVYGVGCERGIHYYAMQLIEGPTVAQVIRDMRARAGLDPPMPEETLTTAPLAGQHVDRVPDSVKKVGARGGSDAAPLADPASPSRSTVPHGILSTARTPRSPAFVQAAVQLGIDVAEALDYAHQEGIVHRDIKPGNLLMDARGKVWVADFGLARIEADPGMTLTGDLLGTLRYMSPEQALGKRVAIDGRSDVYSLGATLYELLTLKPVFDGEDRQAILRQIAFDDPRPLRQLDRALPVELETILLKTLAKNPDERYATAGNLADDLRRFLEQKPIEARRPTMVDRTTKWALRNRRLVVAGALGLLLSVVTLAVASLLIWTEQHKTQHALDTAMEEKERADEQAAIAQAVNEFLQQDLLGQADVNNQLGLETSPDPNVKVRTLLDRASQAIEGRFADQPLLEASIRSTIGSAYLGLGLYPQAEPHLERAWKLRRDTLGEEHTGTLSAADSRVNLYIDQGNFAEAERMAEQLLESRRQLLGPEHSETLESMVRLSIIYQDQARYPEAERLATRAYEIQQRVLGPENIDTLTSKVNLAKLYHYQGRNAEAELHYKSALEIILRVRGPEHPTTLGTLNELAMLFIAEGKYTEAETLIAKALEANRRVLGSEHPVSLISRNIQAELYKAQGKYTQAEPLYTQVIEIQRRVLGPEHPETQKSMNNLALLYEIQQRYSEAEKLHLEVLEISRRTFGSENPSTLVTMNNLALVYKGQGKYMEAEGLTVEVLKNLRKSLGPDHPHTLTVQDNLAVLHEKQAKYAEAETLFTQTLTTKRRVLGSEHPDTLTSMNNLAALHWRLCRLDESIPLFKEALELKRRMLGENHPDTLSTMANLGVSYLDAGRLDEALPLLEASFQRAKDHPSLRWVGGELLKAYVQSHRAEQAKALAGDLLTEARTSLPTDSLQLLNALLPVGHELLELNEWSDAEAVLRECSLINEHRDPASWIVFATRFMLGEALLGQGKHSEAEPLLGQGYEGMKQREAKMPPNLKDDIVEALERLTRLYETMDKPDEAAKWRGELEALKQRLATPPQ